MTATCTTGRFYNSPMIDQLKTTTSQICRSIDMAGAETCNSVNQSTTNMKHLVKELRHIRRGLEEKHRSDAQLLQTLIQLRLIGGDGLKSVGNGVQPTANMPCNRCDVTAPVEIGRVRSDDSYKRINVMHVLFFLSGLAGGLAITSLAGKDR